MWTLVPQNSLITESPCPVANVSSYLFYTPRAPSSAVCILDSLRVGVKCSHQKESKLNMLSVRCCDPSLAEIILSHLL